MKAFLLLLFAYFTLSLGFIAAGVGIGFLLHWILPQVDLGTSILIAVVANGFSIHYFIRLIWFAEKIEEGYEFTNRLPPQWVYTLASPRTPRKRKRKES